MMPPRQNRRANRWALWSLALGALLAGCSVEKHYKTLSFFFDGVPNPNAPKDSRGNPLQSGPGRTAPLLLSVHKPYADEQCKSCHKEGGGKLFDVQSLDSKMCQECHKEEKTPHAYKHAVIAHPECLWCHEPHQSEKKLLLRGDSPALCVQCHDPSVLPTQPPIHQEAAADCLSCHYGHGGPDRRMLKPGAEDRARPATLPVVGGEGSPEKLKGATPALGFDDPASPGTGSESPVSSGGGGR